MTQNVQPIFILSEGTQRTVGRDAQRNNIMAARTVAETVRTTLGPKGMDKMLVSSLGDIIVTNDGVTILKEMDIEHPAAKMIVEIAKTQENEVGDGTTTAVVLAGEFLKNAEKLLDSNIHPTVIAHGYRLAAEKSLEILNKLAENITLNDTVVLKKIAMTAMTGKGAEAAKDTLAELCVQAVKLVQDDHGKVSLDDIKIEKRAGAAMGDSELIRGIVIDKERVHEGMPKSVRNAKIALIDRELEIKKTEIDAKIEITDPKQLQAFMDQEENMLRSMVDKIVATGANVVVCQKGIDDLVQHFLSKKGIYALRRVSSEDMKKLSKATQGKMITNLDDLNKDDLGSAGLVQEKKVGDDFFTFVEECKNPKAVTLMIRGGTEHVIEEIERAVKDALGDVISALKNGKVVVGAGATEIELSKQLKKFADSLSGREQLAVLAFAESLEIVPRTLAENAGLDPIDTLTELKASHDKGQKWSGINVFTGKIMDAHEFGVIEPLQIKTQAVSSASEVSQLILRIDDVIASGHKEKPQGGGGGMPGGMPEY